MKKWRYVCELFQLKSFCPAVHSVNLFWGTPDLYQPGDVALLQTLFDSTIDLRHDPEAQQIYDQARVRSARERPSALARDLCAGAAPSLLRSIAQAVGNALRTPAREANRLLWQKSAERPVGVNRLPLGRQSRWLPLLLRCLLLSGEEMSSLKAFCLGQGQAPPAALDLGIVRPEPGILPGWAIDPAFRAACVSGMVEAFRAEAFAAPRYLPLLREARDAETAEWVAPLYSLLARGPSRRAVAALLQLAPDHPRLVAIDGLLGFFDRSVNSLEPLWDRDLWPLPVKNPVVNLVNRTPHVSALLAPANRQRLTEAILQLWRRLGDAAPVAVRSEADLRRAIQHYRRKCLFEQKLLKVAPFAVRRTFAALGWRETGKRRFGIGSPVEGLSVATEFEFTFEKCRRRVLLRSLYGDKGADHKAEENAGKLFLLPFELRQGTFVSRPVEGSPVFVPEGRWSAEQLDLLASAGWQVVGLEELSGLDAPER
jgi:hypothetical protein